MGALELESASNFPSVKFFGGDAHGFILPTYLRAGLGLPMPLWMLEFPWGVFFRVWPLF